ncbi:MAG: carbonic anhydrase, partial [Sphaerochaetaceae bacterium]|nr:carbonic anhydrase [Sphaerochaetaceae bacterium]
DIVKREWVTEQLNVVEQRKHLLTYPYISKRVNEGKLNIYGWYYMIGTGEVFNYDEEEHRFVLI